MNFRQALLSLTLACGLSACASSPDYGLRYQDGSYYSPAEEGRGDYYVGVEPQHSYYYYDDFDLFFGSGYGWYGSPFYSYGGYCSARYRYCPRWAWGGGYGSPYRESGFQLYFGSPWDPYWGRGYYPSQPYRGGRRLPPRPPTDAKDPQWPSTSGAQKPRPRPRPTLEEDEIGWPASSKGRSPFPRSPGRAPAPSPAPATPSIIKGGGGN